MALDILLLHTSAIIDFREPNTCPLYSLSLVNCCHLFSEKELILSKVLAPKKCESRWSTLAFIHLVTVTWVGCVFIIVMSCKNLGLLRQMKITSVSNTTNSM